MFFVVNALVYAQPFNFKKQLFEEPSSLSLWIETINSDTGKVVINGVDTRRPFMEFTWDWGEGIIYDGWFPQQHTYTDSRKNYIVKVTAHYGNNGIDSAKIPVRFIPISITGKNLDPAFSVTIPDHKVSLTSRVEGFTVPDLDYFDNTFFMTVSRSAVESVLSAAALIQYDFVNSNVCLIDGGFKQVVLRDSSFNGMYSLWQSVPVSFAVGDYGLKGTIQWSSLMHEMGHNFVLNTPSGYRYGGKIDGNAKGNPNAIFSETMAQIFQHAGVYELINNSDVYGLSEDIIFGITQSAVSTIMVLKNSYENYINSGKYFCSWNDYSTEKDETFDTFMVIAYKFCEYAEKKGLGYRTPVKKMMRFLQSFDEDLEQKYNQNNPEADTFRATFMVAALSYGFSTDLRQEFKQLNFPVSDELYRELMSRLNILPEFIDINCYRQTIKCKI